MLLERNISWDIRSLTALHPDFLTPNVIEPRKPLAATARRAGWVGCKIRLDLIAPDAYIEVVEQGLPKSPDRVRQEFQRFNQLEKVDVVSRGWTTLTLRVIRNLSMTDFSLDGLYRREAMFSDAFPGNRNVRAKIRQQLQILRDLGYIEFRGKGNYRLLI
jgi:type II restriction enzyme